jgi:flagellar biosynthesis regulator FlbT
MKRFAIALSLFAMPAFAQQTAQPSQAAQAYAVQQVQGAVSNTLQQEAMQAIAKYYDTEQQLVAAQAEIAQLTKKNAAR